MALLTPTWFAASLSLTLGFWLFQSITGRWLTAVAAILGKLIFERLKSRFQRPDEHCLSLKQRFDRLVPLLTGDIDFIWRR